MSSFLTEGNRGPEREGTGPRAESSRSAALPCSHPIGRAFPLLSHCPYHPVEGSQGKCQCLGKSRPPLLREAQESAGGPLHYGPSEGPYQVLLSLLVPWGVAGMWMDIALECWSPSLPSAPRPKFIDLAFKPHCLPGRCSMKSHIPGTVGLSGRSCFSASHLSENP